MAIFGPLEKCEQPDLKHPQAMLQNDICPQNSPRGERLSSPGPRTTRKALRKHLLLGLIGFSLE